MPANIKPSSKEFICIDKRVGYLALLIVPAVILTVISSMVNSQKMTQNSRASESFRPTKIPTPTPTIKTEYRTAAIDVCFKSLDDIAPLTTFVRYERSEGITEEINDGDAARNSCFAVLTDQIIRKNGEWPGTQRNRVNGISAGWQAANSIAETWLDSGYIHKDKSNNASFNFLETQWQEFLRNKIMHQLENQRKLLGQ